MFSNFVVLAKCQPAANVRRCNYEPNADQIWTEFRPANSVSNDTQVLLDNILCTSMISAVIATDVAARPTQML
jgi:hypothetical protein